MPSGNGIRPLPPLSAPDIVTNPRRATSQTMSGTAACNALGIFLCPSILPEIWPALCAAYLGNALFSVSSTQNT